MNLFARIALIVTTVLAVNSADAQKLTLKLQAENGKPVADGVVSLYGNDTAKTAILTTTTNARGIAIVDITNCPCRMQINMIGYEPTDKYIDYNKDRLITISLVKKPSSLDEVIVTGVARPTRPRDALSLVRTISSSSIQAQGAISLADALAAQLNIGIGTDGILGNNIRMQGLGGDKVKILVDGMPVNGREAGNVDLGQLNLNNTDHIEIIQGPMSVLYGADALGGVINMVSKENFKKKTLSVNANYQTAGWYNFNISGSHKLGERHNISLSAGRNYFQGWKYTDTSYHHRQQLFKPKEQYFANFDYGYNARSGFKIRLASDYMHEKVVNKGAAFISPFDAYAFDDHYNTQRSMNRLSLQGKLFKHGYLQVMNSYAYYHRVKNTFLKDLVTMNETESTGARQDTTLSKDFNSRTTYNDKIGKLEYTIGYDLAIENIMTTKAATGAKQITDLAGLLMITMPIYKEKLKLQGGFRASYNTNYKTPGIPSANLLFKPNEKWQLRASYGKGYRAPSLKEMYLEFIDFNHHILGNENLKPENADHYEISSSYQFFHRQNDYMQLLVSGMYNDVYDEITLINQAPNDPNSIFYTYGNLAHDQNAIGNIQLEGQAGRLYFNLGYSYTHVYGQEGSYDAFKYSETTVNLRFLFSRLKTNFNIYYKYNGAQLTPQPDISGGASFNGSTPEYHMCKMSLERKFWNKRIHAVTGVDNLFNVQSLNSTGAIISAHSGNGMRNFLPRSFFTTLRVTLE